MAICGVCCEEEEKRRGKNSGWAFIGWKPRNEGSTGSTKAFGAQGFNH